MKRTPKNRSGLDSDTNPIGIPPASTAAADDYPDWLLSKCGAVPPELDLEF